MDGPRVAIVDYGMGNLFSVKHACEHVGIAASLTSTPQEILQADAVILPGVGAFGDAMETLRERDLIAPLRDVAASGKPFVGICLGMQLLMEESFEFGRYAGLGLIPGNVVRLDSSSSGGRPVKVPQVCWNRLTRVGRGDSDSWAGTLLEGLPDGVFMYFVHSFVVVPNDSRVIISKTHYGPNEFCSALAVGNIFACQCHPERSGKSGLQVYHNLALWLQNRAS
jgi:glutamine amidotransferase